MRSLYKIYSIFAILYRNNLYYADRSIQAIKKITSSGKILIIAGQINKKGFRNGDLKNTLFNNIFNLAYYSPNDSKKNIENSTFTIILTNASQECLNVNFTNYTVCQNNDTNNTSINDIKLIKRIVNITRLNEYLLIKNSTTSQKSLVSGPSLFIADKDNHCIRLIDLTNRISTTYAGICTSPGFKDGSVGMNLFNYPESLGVDVFGNVFVYDSGNKYIRMIKNDGCVVTLVPGACRRDFKYEPLYLPKFNLKNDYVTCYRQWMNSTTGDSICYSGNESNFCFKTVFECNSENSPFIYNDNTN